MCPCNLLAVCRVLFYNESNTNIAARGGAKWNLRSHLKPKRKGAYGSYILYFSDNLVNKNINQLVRQRKEFKSVSFNVFTE